MFSPFAAPSEEDFFANINYSKNIDCILSTCELLINFRLNGVLAKKPCYVYAEKMDFKGLIQLRIVEKSDQRRMYITTVDGNSFHALKQDQSLHVTFSGFIENLIKILHDCQAGKLEISIVQLQPIDALDGSSSSGSSAVDFQLQFYEMRSFKNLVHLCLPMRLAPLSVVIFYMNSIMEGLQKKNAAQEHTIQSLQNELNVQQHRIETCELEKAKLRDSFFENTKTQTQRHNEEIQRLEEDLKKLSEQRHNDNERNRNTINGLQHQLELSITEKSNALAEKCQEQKRNEHLSDEIVRLKSDRANLKEQNEKLHAEISSLQNLERKNDMHLSDMRKHITELQEKLKKYDKVKADIVAELEAEKKISQTKRQALEMTTEEITKANEIIIKQSQELIKLKKTIGWRTEVALQQEKAVNEKEHQIQLQEKQISSMQNTIESLRLQIPQQLESIRQFASSIELKYSEQIKALKNRIVSIGKENLPAYSTTHSNRIRK